MELKGTKTEKNLMEAFAGESQARNKYTFFASVAKKEGYIKSYQRLFGRYLIHYYKHPSFFYCLMDKQMQQLLLELPQIKFEKMKYYLLAELELKILLLILLLRNIMPFLV